MEDKTFTLNTLVAPPDYVGGYRIGKLTTGYIQFNLTHKQKKLSTYN